MGMGGAFIGVADDFTAIHWNPAGLAQIRHFELSGGLSHSIFDTSSQFTGSSENKVSESATKPNSVGIVWPVGPRRNGLTFGFGVNRVQSFDRRSILEGTDPLDNFNIDEKRRSEGNIYEWSFGGAGYISKNISLGLSLDFWSGGHSQELDTLATDTTNVDKEIYDMSFYDTIDRHYWGFSGKAGSLVRLSKYMSLGATVTFPMLLEINEDWTQDTFTRFDDNTEGSDYDSGYFDYNIKRPFEFGGGIAFHFNNLLLAADLQYADWTQTEYSEPPAEDVSNEDFDEFYRDTVEVRVGGEFLIPAINSKIRAGYLRNPIAFDAESITNERDFLTFGVGTIIDEVLELNAAYLLGLWEKSDGSLRQKETSHQVFVSFAYRY
jgi:long-subunit fatty acid transport protein